jgi:phosphotransferase system HPr (HPr) family protein
LNLLLSDALHARPASLFVRVACMYASAVALRRGQQQADGKKILEVLALGAGSGETLELEVSGNDAEAALAALTALVERNFDADLVPETGTMAAPGIALGRAIVLPADPAGDEDTSGAGDDDSATPNPPDAEQRIKNAFAQVVSDLEHIVKALPSDEAVLFEPEVAIVRELEKAVLARVAAGDRPDHAVREETSLRGAPNSQRAAELVVDARDRLLEAYDGERSTRLALRLAREAAQGDVVLVVETLTPSLVAAAPDGVVGIIAAAGDDGAGPVGRGYLSHAAILARGRAIPLVFVASHVALAIGDGETIVLDATNAPPRLWVSPSEARLAEARSAKEEHERNSLAGASRLQAPLAHLAAFDDAPFAVRVNVGSVHDAVPRGAEGIGLVRTELFFVGRTHAPNVEDQLSALLLVAGKAGRAPVVARLFDAGGDKPIRWLAPPPGAPESRGFDLLRRHRDVLSAQIAAFARAKEHADVRLLIPLVHRAEEIAFVRAMAPRGLPVGAMIESPDAAAEAGEIAEAADFICIGTNDLAAFVRGEDRAHAMAATFDPRVLSMVSSVVQAAHAHGRTVTVCGEMAGDPDAASVLVGLGVDAISVTPSRWSSVKGALFSATRESCAEAARAAMTKGDQV